MSSIEIVRDTLLNSYVSVKSPRSILVGLSGGADSVALLLALYRLQQERGFSLTAVHVNHGLRENASLDEEFCRALCKDLCIPLRVTRVEIKGKSNLEARAREARYAAFRDALHEMGTKTLALAHHADDQAETMLMHLLYGAGGGGLSGMQEYAHGVWRPFLKLRRYELQAYLEALHYPWREDESNRDIAFTRNRIRAQLIPAIEAFAPEAVRCMGRTAEVLRAEDDYLNAAADAWILENSSCSDCPFLLTAPLASRHIALQRRTPRRYAQQLGILLDFVQTERLRSLLTKSPGSTENLSGGWRAFKSKSRLHFVADEMKTPAENSLPGKLLTDRGEAGDNRCRQAIPSAECYGLQLRTRRRGDYIQPFGMQGRKSLKEYMIDHAMDRPLRDAWPLVCRDSEVLWVIGIGASEKLRVDKTEQCTDVLIYTGILPDECGRK